MMPSREEITSFKTIKSWDMTSDTPYKKQIHMDIDEEPQCNSNVNSKPYLIEPLNEVLGMDPAELHKDMLEHEGLFGDLYNPNASYIPYRRYLVDWMSDLGERFHILNSTIHCAIFYMDKILTTRDIPKRRWQLLATACVSVACKFEEAEEHCPPIPDMLEMTRLNISSLEFRDSGELEVLRLLGWQLRALPPNHFVNFFMCKGILFEDDRWQGNRKIMEKIPKYVKKYAEFFCNLCLQDYVFSKYSPSLLGAAICAAARAALNLNHEWRSELDQVTGYSFREVNPVFKHIWSHYEEQFPGHGKRTPSPQSISGI